MKVSKSCIPANVSGILNPRALISAHSRFNADIKYEYQFEKNTYSIFLNENV